MPLLTAYNSGTISVANGSKNVVGVGTAFVDAGIQPGDVLWNVDGTASQRIDTITDNTHMTLVNNWGGTSLSDAAYEVRITPPSASIAATVRALLEKYSVYADTINPIDVFLAAGQSNMQGGTTTDDAAANSPVPQPGTAFKYDGGVLSAATNNMNSGRGGPLPAFCIGYYNGTGNKICVVPAAFGGTGMTSNSDSGNGYWGAGGTLFATSISLLTSAISALIAAGYTPVVRGVLWCQGENDGYYINTAATTKAEYKTATEALIAGYRTAIGDSLPFYIFKTGTEAEYSDAGYAQVRAAQEEIAAADPYTHIVFRNALDFQTRAGYINTDQEHYKQIGYNEMGAVGAASVIAANSVEGFQFPALGSTDLYYNGGKVGIGTSSPGALSHVWQGASGATKNVNALQILEGSTTAYHQIIVPAATAGGYLIGNPTSGSYGGMLLDASGNLNFRTNSLTRLSIDASGNITLGSGTAAFANPLWVSHTGDNLTAAIIGDPATPASKTGLFGRSTTEFNVAAGGAAILTLGTQNHKQQICVNDANGRVGIGTTSPTASFCAQGANSDNILLCRNATTNLFFSGLGSQGYAGGANTGNTALTVWKDSTTGRSINSAGTNNASGADYADYYFKRIDCGAIAKGQCVGFDSAGLITDKWSLAKSFGIKSTAPSYVGGDLWGTPAALGREEPVAPVAPREPGDDEEAMAAFPGLVTQYQAALGQYEADKAAFTTAYETARAKVDRIAVAGKVPAIVTGAVTAGDFVVAAQDGDGIKLVAIAAADIAFDQYKARVGRVLIAAPSADQIRTLIPDDISDPGWTAIIDVVKG